MEERVINDQWIENSMELSSYGLICLAGLKKTETSWWECWPSESVMFVELAAMYVLCSAFLCRSVEHVCMRTRDEN